MLNNVEDEGVKVLYLIIHVPFYGKFNSKSNDCLFSLHSNPVNSFVLMNNITKEIKLNQSLYESFSSTRIVYWVHVLSTGFKFIFS